MIWSAVLEFVSYYAPEAPSGVLAPKTSISDVLLCPRHMKIS